jgi:hypothetical protein
LSPAASAASATIATAGKISQRCLGRNSPQLRQRPKATLPPQILQFAWFSMRDSVRNGDATVNLAKLLRHNALADLPLLPCLQLLRLRGSGPPEIGVGRSGRVLKISR